MTEQERRLVGALALMAHQYLTRDGALDSECMSAGEATLDALAEHGLVTISGGRRFAEWTEEGLQLLNSADLK